MCWDFVGKTILGGWKGGKEGRVLRSEVTSSVRVMVIGVRVIQLT